MSEHYYEAWIVTNGKIEPESTFDQTMMDRWTKPPSEWEQGVLPLGTKFHDMFGRARMQKKTQGWVTLSGRARYFDGVTTKELKEKYRFKVRTGKVSNWPWVCRRCPLQAHTTSLLLMTPKGWTN